MNKNQQLKKAKQQLADELFYHYSKSVFPEKIFSSMQESGSYCIPGNSCIERNILLNENSYCIIYEISFNKPDKEEKQLGVEASYCISYLFIDKKSQTICDIDGLFDTFCFNSQYTVHEALQDAKQNYIEKIKEDIESKLNIYKNDSPFKEIDFKKHIKKSMFQSQNMIKTLFPEIYFQIPIEIFSE